MGDIDVNYSFTGPALPPIDVSQLFLKYSPPIFGDTFRRIIWVLKLWVQILKFGFQILAFYDNFLGIFTEPFVFERQNL
jgi:hypothetical protein